AEAARLRLAFAADPGSMTPDEYCRQKAAASGSSFYYSFLFLPPERRRAITALYAFCREVDDVVDETSETHIAATKLAWWRSEVGNLFSGNPQHPVSKALSPHLERFSITSERLGEIIAGMEMDLTQTRYLDWPGLERYCYLVAGVVGLLAAGIFGYRDARTLEYARELGSASACQRRTSCRPARRRSSSGSWHPPPRAHGNITARRWRCFLRRTARRSGPAW
ncbi:MAG: hpnD, partial [Burkholderiales bacterium]|nr:hpnD [Burkholderiales bacterium]